VGFWIVADRFFATARSWDTENKNCSATLAHSHLSAVRHAVFCSPSRLAQAEQRLSLEDAPLRVAEPSDDGICISVKVIVAGGV